ncbi:MAG: acyltransferase [Verrucomicrobiaceae bacterium]|nr:acyltransferase [Verrucomicrobiaceae bacterium]
MAVGGVVALVSALGFVVLRSMAAWAGWSAVWPMMMFPLLIWGLVGAGRTWLDGRVMRWLGDLSYSMYLWQGPIMLITYYQIRPRVMGLPLGLRVIWAAVEIALLLGVSFLSYQKLERPARRWVRQWLKEGIVTN